MSKLSAPAEIVRVADASQLAEVHLNDLINVPTDANATPLSDEEVKAARQAGMINTDITKLQLNDFRRMRTSRQYKPINNQQFAVLSFVPSTNAKGDNDNCFGLMRLGGNFATQSEAEKRCEELLRQDSTREYLVTYVGLDFPITSDDLGVLKKEEIDLSEKNEEISRQNERRLEEIEEQKALEIEEARENLLSDVKKKRTPDDIDTYIETCVKQANSEQERAKALDIIAKCNRIIVATEPILRHIVDLHPEYRQKALVAYEAQCKKVGLDPKQTVIADFIDFERNKEHKAVEAVEAEEKSTGSLTLSN